MPEQRKNVPSLWSSGVFGDFRREMDSLIDNFFGNDATPAGWSSLPRGAVSPAIDVSESDEAITLTAELPGLAESDVDLSVHDGVLTLKGEKKHERDEEKDNYHVSERVYGSFQRTMPVPDRVDAEMIKAKFDKGVLVVTMPKKPEAVNKTRKISIGK